MTGQSPHTGIPVKQSKVRQPIWAPNPAVPLAARILSFAFGMLMFFTVIVSNASLRPQDLPVVPKLWRTYTSSDFSMPYPDGWKVQEVPTDEPGSAQAYFFMPPDDYIRVETVFVTDNEPFDAETLMDMQSKIDRKLGKEFSRYTPAGNAENASAVDEWHRFTGRMKDETKRPITGVWMLKVQGARALYLEAITPDEGWPSMEQIFATMTGNVKLAADRYSESPGFTSYRQ